VFQVACDTGKVGQTSALTSGTTSGQLLFGGRGRSQRRHVLLYDNHLIFCKPTSNSGEKGQQASGPTYQFKFAISISGLGMSSVVKGDEKKMELWVHHGRGRESCYTLEAKNKATKEEFAAELRKVIIRQNDDGPSRQKQQQQQQQQHPQVYFDASASSSSETGHQRQAPLPAYYYGYSLGGPGGQTRSSQTTNAASTAAARYAARLARSRSCDTARQGAHALRSRSVDAAGEEDHCSPEEDDEEGIDGGHRAGNRYVLISILAIVTLTCSKIVPVNRHTTWYVYLNIALTISYM